MGLYLQYPIIQTPYHQMHCQGLGLLGFRLWKYELQGYEIIPELQKFLLNHLPKMHKEILQPSIVSDSGEYSWVGKFLLGIPDTSAIWTKHGELSWGWVSGFDQDG
jgi:hypothetical protein